jgi:peroxiredoxin
MHDTVKRILFGLVLVAISVLAHAEPAPAFTLLDASGKSVSNRDYAGKTLVLYFLSFRCPHCTNIQPLMNELQRESRGRYQLLGVVFGTRQKELAQARDKAGVAFPVAAGNKAIREAYHVPGTPYFTLVDRNGRLAERFSGEPGALVLQQALRACAADPAGLDECLTRRVGLAELARNPKRFEGTAIRTGGLLAPATATYFPQGRFLLTNGQDRVAVSAWLPLEVTPSPPHLKKKPAKAVMSDLLGRYVSIEGRVRLEGGQPRIEVIRATPAEVTKVTPAGGKNGLGLAR